MNQLKDAISPYLLQHQDNPVHWYPWGQAAFDMAKAQNKPIFLSIGYSSCHWCHVMAHESFESQEVANVLNQHYISIKVDREERPDIDRVYMEALLQISGHGGWPMSMFLHPDGRPFFGGTYFPPEPSEHQVGFMELLENINDIWQNQPDKILDACKASMDKLKAKLPARTTGADADWQKVMQLAKNALGSVDYTNGGFKGAPKFPQIPLWQWLYEAAKMLPEPRLKGASELTAKKICDGGLFDHVAGGWMRYSTDDAWLVPHFEKMLYDNALIIDYLADISLNTHLPEAKRAVSKTIDWLRTDMLQDVGVFASSIDADSEGEEGRYYVWSYDELIQHCNTPAMQKALVALGASEEGNWEGNIILNRLQPTDGVSEQDIADTLKHLDQIRKARIAPAIDDKLLLDWNALLVGALAKAGFVFAEPSWIKLAEDTYATLHKIFFKDEQWFHCMRQDRHSTPALLDDYAFLIEAALQLHCFTGRDDYLEDAKALVGVVNEHCLDKDNGLYNQSANQNDVPLIIDMQPLFDNATPSGNGKMASVLAKLSLLTGDQKYTQQLKAMLNATAPLAFSGQNFAMGSFNRAFALLHTGVCIKANLNQGETSADILAAGGLPGFSLLVHNVTQSNIDCCDSSSCFASEATWQAAFKVINERRA